MTSGHRNTPAGTRPNEHALNRRPPNFVCPQTQYDRLFDAMFHFDAERTQFSGYDETPSGGAICRKCGEKVQVLREG